MHSQNCEEQLLASSSLCLSGHMKQLGFQLTDFHEI